MSNREKAGKYMLSGFNCAQSVISTLGPSLGLDKEMCLKISSGFGGGMGRMQNTCGAVSGAFMAIGLKHGQYKEEDKDSKELTYNLVRKFAAEFKKKHETINCRELLGCDYTTEEGMKFAQENNLFGTLCVRFVRDAIEITEEILGLK